MMDTDKDFKAILYNIKNHTKSGGVVVVLCMDGEKIDKYFKRNNGKRIIKAPTGEVAFELDANYDYNKSFNKLSHFGNKITVKMAGTYGLQEGINENLVSVNFIESEIKNVGFDLISKKNFLDITIPARGELRKHERKISELYVGLVFRKK